MVNHTGSVSHDAAADPTPDSWWLPELLQELDTPAPINLPMLPRPLFATGYSHTEPSSEPADNDYISLIGGQWNDSIAAAAGEDAIIDDEDSAHETLFIGQIMPEADDTDGELLAEASENDTIIDAVTEDVFDASTDQNLN